MKITNIITALIAGISTYTPNIFAASDPNEKTKPVVYTQSSAVYTSQQHIVTSAPLNIQILNFENKNNVLLFLPSTDLLQARREMLNALSKIGETGNYFLKFNRDASGEIHEEEVFQVFTVGFGQAGQAPVGRQDLSDKGSILSSAILKMNFSIVQDTIAVLEKGNSVSCFSELKVESQIQDSSANNALNGLVLTHATHSVLTGLNEFIDIENGNLQGAIQKCLSGLEK